MPPIPQHGEVLCDGGLLDNLPVAAIRALGVDRVLASDVSSSASMLTADPELAYCPSGFRLLARRLNPFRARYAVPNILGMAYQSILCAAVSQQLVPGNKPDLPLRPHLEQFDMADFGRHAEMVEIGRRFGLRNREDILALRQGLPGDGDGHVAALHARGFREVE
jgi:lysophospholipid hydrolase